MPNNKATLHTVHSPHSTAFRPGIDTLLSKHKGWLKGKRVGLISHLAAVDSKGCTSAQRLWDASNIDLVCLMGPEHGYFGRASAGETCRAAKHPDWKIPIHSLYGKQRKPSKRILDKLDAVVFDLQDLGYRPYTYVSTMRLALEACAESNTPIIIADRPIPLPSTVDGPMLDPNSESFVSAIPAPMVYGMTPGETALWLQATVVTNVDLRIAKMQGYTRNSTRMPDWPPWLRPSPSIVSWESAICFPATVCFEGVTAVDHGRATDMPFQLIGAPWTNGEELCQALKKHRLPGITFYSHHYQTKRADYAKNKTLSGIRMVITNPTRFRPILTGITIIHCLQELYGSKRVWNPRNCREKFFDKLLGTDQVRIALQNGDTPKAISSHWKSGIKRFKRNRKEHLLYGGGNV